MELVLPSEKYKESFFEALKELRNEGRYTDDEVEEITSDFSKYLEKHQDNREGRNLASDRVPETMYWLVDGDTYIGRVNIRHFLNENLVRIGGHIGYIIRPSMRAKGYGTKILELALPKAKELGIEKALITCDVTNIASRKIIEKCGGVFLDQSSNPPGPDKLRFEIAL